MRLSYVYPILILCFLVYQVVLTKYKSNDEYARCSFAGHFVFTLLLSFVAYNTSAVNNSDIDYKAMSVAMQTSRQQGFSYLTGYEYGGYGYGTHPLSAGLLYVIGLTGHYALLKSLAVAVFFGVLTAVCYKCLKKGLSWYAVLLGWLLVVSVTDFSESFLNNVRLPLGASLIIYAIINMELFHGNKIVSWVLIVAGCLIHIGLLIYIPYYLLAKLPGKIGLAVSVLCPLLTGFIVQSTYPIMSVISPSLALKIYQYLLSPGEKNYNSTKLTLYYAVLPLVVIVLFLLIYFWMKESVEIPLSDNIKSYSVVACSWSMLSIGLIPFTPLFVRYAARSPLIALPLIVFLLHYFSLNSSKEILRFSGKQSMGKYLRTLLPVFLFLFSVASLILRCVYNYRWYYFF